MTSKSFIPLGFMSRPRLQSDSSAGHLGVTLLWLALFSLFFAPITTCWGVQDSQQPTRSKSEIILPLSDDKVADGWISLFDGQSLYGWQPVTKANWSVENGEIRVSEGEKGLLRTTSQFDDFEITFEYKSDERTNSGVFLRSSPKPKNVKRDCYEWNIASPKDHKYLSLIHI